MPTSHARYSRTGFGLILTMIVIEMTEDNYITRVYAIRPPLGIPKEIEYRIEYVDEEESETH